MAKKRKRKLWHESHEPIPEEIEARLTKPKTVNGLYQVQCLTVEPPTRMVTVGPKVVQAVAEELCVAIKVQIASGKEHVWKEPHVVPASMQEEQSIIV